MYVFNRNNPLAVAEGNLRSLELVLRLSINGLEGLVSGDRLLVLQDIASSVRETDRSGPTLLTPFSFSVFSTISVPCSLQTIHVKHH